MRVAIPGHQSEITLEAGMRAEDIAVLLSDETGLGNLAEQHARDSAFSRFMALDELSEKQATELAHAFLTGGEEKAMAWLEEQSILTDPSDYFHQVVWPELASDTQAIVEAVAEAVPDLDEDILAEELHTQLLHKAVRAMEESDSTSLSESVNPRLTAAVTFVPELGDRYFEDLVTSYNDTISSAETIICDETFMNCLEFLKIKPSHFIAVCREYGYDPSNPERSENTSDYRWRGFVENAQSWRAVLDAEDGNVPEASARIPAHFDWEEMIRSATELGKSDAGPVISDIDIINILDNATYGGVPVWYGHVSLKTILEGGLSKPFKTKGGVVGLHDFINGSGHVEFLKTPITIDPASGGFYQPREPGYGVHDVYGFVWNALVAETEAAAAAPSADQEAAGFKGP